jgi:hypothetical protein
VMQQAQSNGEAAGRAMASNGTPSTVQVKREPDTEAAGGA